jgi:two-component system, cell cycle sensor histidine kinase and response regulator CckA
MHAADYCIVVAEDDEVLRYCTARLLRDHGYKIIEARDGVEALELLEKCDDVVHLLVTNYDMPRLNGVELARKLRAKHERLLVLLISGSDLQDIDPDDDIELLPKPYNQAALATKVRELLRRGASDNSAPTQS